MSSSEAAPADALPRVVGILGAGRAGTALARAIARIPRLSPGTAAPRVMVAGTRRPAAVQRHLTIYAPEAVAVSAEDLAAEAELVVVAVPREALDDVDHVGWQDAPAEPPARHAEIFREAVDDDGAPLEGGGFHQAGMGFPAVSPGGWRTGPARLDLDRAGAAKASSNRPHSSSALKPCISAVFASRLT